MTDLNKFNLDCFGADAFSHDQMSRLCKILLHSNLWIILPSWAGRRICWRLLTNFTITKHPVNILEDASQAQHDKNGCLALPHIGWERGKK